MSGARLISLTAMQSAGGFAWVVSLPDDAADGDEMGNNHRSGLRLFEDGRELGPGHSMHETIRRKGRGAFSHWRGDLFFSTSDGSDPRTNNFSYEVLFPLAPQSRHVEILSAALAAPVQSLGAEECYAWGERAFSAFVPGVHLSEFGRSYFNDREFVDDYESFSPTNYRSFDRKFALKELAKLAVELTGDFAECGVFEGASAYLMAKVLETQGGSGRLHLFDSFAGLSEPGQRDGSYWKKGSLACDLVRVEANLARYAHRALLYPGWIPDRFPDVADVRFSFVHIDVDLYAPTRAALEFFSQRMVDGGIVVCDDYGFDTCPGARLAMDEFAKSFQMPIVHLPTGQGVMFVRSRGASIAEPSS